MTVNLAQIREHMEVVAPDGGHVGTVDKVEGRQIKLTKNDPAAHGEHHLLDADQVASVDDKVHLNSTVVRPDPSGQ